MSRSESAPLRLRYGRGVTRHSQRSDMHTSRGNGRDGSGSVVSWGIGLWESMLDEATTGRAMGVVREQVLD